MLCSRCSAVSILQAKVLEAGIRLPKLTSDFLVSKTSRPAQFPIQCVLGRLYQGQKRPGREADHSPPYSGEVKNEWTHTSTHLTCHHGRRTLPFAF
jgi:hypothetical protein